MTLEAVIERIKPIARFKAIRDLMRLIEACKYLDRRVWDHEGGNNRIYEALMTGKPLAIGKLGSVELQAVRHYLLERGNESWQEKTAIYRRFLYTNAGVFPDEPSTYVKYCEYLLGDVLPEMTHIITWFNNGEQRIVNRHCKNYTPISIMGCAPYLWPRPWSMALAGRKALIVHPFKDTVLTQYPKLKGIWGDRQIFPEFELDVLRVPHSPALVPPKDKNWFETLERLKDQMAAKLFDVAIIGAGAYSLPLAVHARSLGKQGIHTGGETQFLFGIKGGRWDKMPKHYKYYNKFWIRPVEADTPHGNNMIEGGCYW
jgi:hypothetical protein